MLCRAHSFGTKLNALFKLSCASPSRSKVALFDCSSACAGNQRRQVLYVLFPIKHFASNSHIDLSFIKNITYQPAE